MCGRLGHNYIDKIDILEQRYVQMIFQYLLFKQEILYEAKMTNPDFHLANAANGWEEISK